MAIPTTKATFKSYCLRALGFGVIDINVSDDQVDDRIDEILEITSLVPTPEINIESNIFVNSVDMNAVYKEMPVDSIHKPITKLTLENERIK